ncbi:uncharacterized protein LOC125141181 isoform X1 [Tachysurus ichikawai]
MFDFQWKGKTWCIDAAKEDGSFGRLVNDDHKHPNCRMKKIEVDRRPHLCLFALKDIKQGQEITYDYGGTDWPWHSKVMEDNPAENNVQEKQQPSQSTSLLDHNTATSASVTEQQSSSEDSDEQDMCIPRLRRTKSVFMKDLIPDASDELFDSTPDSGEEYVPDSKDDRDESSSESSMIVKPLNLCRSDTDPVLPSSSVPDSTTPNVMDKSSHETMEVTDHSQVRDSDVVCNSPTNVQKKARLVVNSVKRKHDGGRAKENWFRTDNHKIKQKALNLCIVHIAKGCLPGRFSGGI